MSETFKPCGYYNSNPGPFPAVCHLSTWHVIGWQQHYSAKIMLAIYAKLQHDSFMALNQYMLVCQGEESCQPTREHQLICTKREVVDPARRLCGICFSCDDIGSEINGSHLISWFGNSSSAERNKNPLWPNSMRSWSGSRGRTRTCSERLKRIWNGEQCG